MRGDGERGTNLCEGKWGVRDKFQTNLCEGREGVRDKFVCGERGSDGQICVRGKGE